MTRTREEWIQAASAKSDGGVYTGTTVFVKVENLSEAMVTRFGKFQHTTLEKGLRGEKDGAWRIVDALGVDREGNVGQEREVQ